MRGWLAVVAALAAFYAVPVHRSFVSHLVDLVGDIPADLSADRSVDALMERHHGWNHTVPALIRDGVGDDDVLLLPPREYFAAFVPAAQLLWLEAKVRFYVAGPVDVVGVGSERATHALIIQPGTSPTPRIVEIRDSTDRRRVEQAVRRGGRR